MEGGKKEKLLFTPLIKYKRDKRKSRKGDFSGQCLKIGCDLPYTRCFAFTISGNSKGAVDQAIITKVQVGPCPEKARIKFYSFDRVRVPHFFITRKADRAFNKTKFYAPFNDHFDSTNNYSIGYDPLLKNECRDSFKTVKFWHPALEVFKNKIQSNSCNTRNPKLTKKANIMVSSYFYLVSNNQ